MAINDPLHRLKKRVEPLSGVECEDRRHHVGIACAINKMMEEDSFLERRQGVDILDIGRATGNTARNGGNFFLSEPRKWKHIWRDLSTAERYPIRRNLQGAYISGQCSGQLRERGRHKDRADVSFE